MPLPAENYLRIIDAYQELLTDPPQEPLMNDYSAALVINDFNNLDLKKRKQVLAAISRMHDAEEIILLPPQKIMLEDLIGRLS